MQVKELAAQCGWALLAGRDGEDREVVSCYVGDLLSWVMANAGAGDVMVTVMGNVNAIAVASLVDAACIVLTENASLDAEAKEKADIQGIPIYRCEKNSYETAVHIHRELCS